MTYDQWKTRNLDDEMMGALEEDGDKLRQLTGEDHGPFDFPPPPKCDWCARNELPVRKVWERYGNDVWICDECDELRQEGIIFM